MKIQKNLGEVVGVEGKIKITEPSEYIPLLFVKDEKEIARLEFEGDKVIFKGNVDKAARQFFEISKEFIDKYIKEKLKKEIK